MCCTLKGAKTIEEVQDLKKRGIEAYKQICKRWPASSCVKVEQLNNEKQWFDPKTQDCSNARTGEWDIVVAFSPAPNVKTMFCSAGKVTPLTPTSFTPCVGNNQCNPGQTAPQTEPELPATSRHNQLTPAPCGTSIASCGR